VYFSRIWFDLNTFPVGAHTEGNESACREEKEEDGEEFEAKKMTAPTRTKGSEHRKIETRRLSFSSSRIK
jgi:hypothetical protein